jgi:hypothetical protein
VKFHDSGGQGIAKRLVSSFDVTETVLRPRKTGRLYWESFFSAVSFPSSCAQKILPRWKYTVGYIELELDAETFTLSRHATPVFKIAI